ncbi:hypothetical protein [Mycobacterium sp. 852002-50816_SCH5313054-b]|uniref:hypothetical protein n=1 Tax=Mycobacterium sp. 852002-50816_SCH5313054-b TaxID=1834092 RepID=UPI0018D40BE5|nr:hypothetical protein [Mycobacterium sp. 852002-50816_SCH5313054-b]
MMNPQPPPAAQWTPPAQIRKPASGRLTAVGLVVIGLIATAALIVGIVALTRPATDAAGKAPTPATPTPSFTPDQVAGAKKELCAAYQLAARSVHFDTNLSDRALARISLVNGAGLLDAAATNPALSANDRDAARALASAYRTSNAVSSDTDASSPLYQMTLDDITKTDAAMAAICR